MILKHFLLLPFLFNASVSGYSEANSTEISQPFHCDALPLIENGTKSTNGTALNVVIQFTCEEGDVLDGTASIVCQGSGSWSNSLLSCVKVLHSCGFLCSFANGSTSVVRFDCDSSGAWSNNKPSCQALSTSCESLSPPANGTILTGNASTMKVTFSCISGYILSGPSSVSCLENGTWSGDAPVGIPVQPTPVRLIGSRLIRSSAVIKGLLEVYYNEKWSSVCVPDYAYWARHVVGGVVCRQLGLGRSGSIYDSRMSAEGLFFFNGVHCTGSENQLAQCPSNGVFRGTTDTCSSVLGATCDNSRCSKLYVPFSSAEISRNATTTKVTFSCQSGYFLTGSSSISCMENNEGSHHALRCIPVSIVIPILTSLLLLIVSGLTVTFTNTAKRIFSLCAVYYFLLTVGSLLLAILIAIYYFGSKSYHSYYVYDYYFLEPVPGSLAIQAVVNADAVLYLSPFFTQKLFHLFGDSNNSRTTMLLVVNIVIVIVDILIAVISSFIFSGYVGCDKELESLKMFSSIILSYWVNGALALASGIVIWIAYCKDKHRSKCQSISECLTASFLAALYLAALFIATLQGDCAIRHQCMVALATFPALLTLHVLTFHLIKTVFAKKYTLESGLPMELSIRDASVDRGDSLEADKVEVSQLYYWDEDIAQQIDSVVISPSRIQREVWIGRGNFGAVFKGKMDNAVVAMKSVLGEMNRKEVNDFVREGLRMSQFDHPNVLKLLGICWSNNPSNPYHHSPLIILPYMELGDLKTYLRKCRPGKSAASVQNEVSEGKIGLIQLVKFSLQIAKGMEYISSKGVVHRDLAARNCMVNWNLEVKVGDFGLSKVLKEGKDYYRTSERGALPVRWMSPECLFDFIFTTKSDVWSFGIIIWEVMTLGMMPYPGTSNQEVMSFVKSGQRLAKPEECPLEVYNIMLSCWSAKPDERLSFTKIVDFFEDYLTVKMNYFNMNSGENDPYAHWSLAAKGICDSNDVAQEEEVVWM